MKFFPFSILPSCFLLAALLCFVCTNVAAQSTGTIQTDGEVYRFGYSGGNEKYRDLTIPEDYDPVANFNQITFALRGGAGGRRRVPGICTEPAGRGARVDVSFEVGFGEGKISPGGIIRIFTGQQGGSVKGGGLAGAGGGGGSAVLYAAPSFNGNSCVEDGFNTPSIEWDTTCWVLLTVAGGGGGAYAPGGCSQASSGKPGNGGTNGTDGKGITPGPGGANGRGGGSAEGQGGSGGGYRGNPDYEVTEGDFGGDDGGEGGISDPVLYARGGYGYGGGGSGLRTWLIARGGGGGGFSGGGHGSQYEGGGGGGSFANAFASFSDKRDGNGTDRTPNNGYVSYFFDNNTDLVDPPVAVCKDTTVFIVGDDGQVFPEDVASESTDPNNRPLTFTFDFDGFLAASIGFDCDDIGDEDIYTVRVDNGFTSSTCLTNIDVEQGVPGDLICPAAQTINIFDCDGILNNNQTNPGMAQLQLDPDEFPTCDYTLSTFILKPDGSIDSTFQLYNDETGLRTDTFDFGTSQIVYTVEYENEEGVDESQTCLISLTLEGEENFELDCPNDIQVDVPNGDPAAGECSIELEDAIGGFDLDPRNPNCGTFTYTITPDHLNPTITTGTGEIDAFDFPLGVTTVEYTLEKLPNEFYSCSFTVSINGRQIPDPTITNCPSGTVEIDIYEGITDEEIVSQVSFDTSAFCEISSIRFTDLDLSCNEIGDLQRDRRLTVTDTDGGDDVCFVDVRTRERLLVNCVDDIVVSVESGFCLVTIAANLLAPTAQPTCPSNLTYSIVNVADNQPVASGNGEMTEQVLSAGQYSAGYSIQSGSNIAGCGFTIQVLDEDAPVVTCQNATVNLSELPANPAELLFVSATDNCSTTFTPSISETLGCDNVGNNTLIVTVTDESGREGFCSAVLTIIDDVQPLITACPPNRTINLDANCQALIPDLSNEITATSECNDALFPSQGPEPGFLITSTGTTEVAMDLVEADGQGASNPCAVLITFADVSPPTAECRNNTTVYLDDNGVASIITANVNNGSFDNCSSILEFSFDANTSVPQLDFDCDDLTIFSTLLVPLFVRDEANNVENCVGGIIIRDTVPPTAVCQDISIPVTSEPTSITASQINNGSSDNCGAIALSLDRTDFTCVDIGQMIDLTLSVSDGTNTSSCAAMVTVTDGNAAPITVNITGNSIIEGDAGTTPISLPIQLSGGATDQEITVNYTLTDGTATSLNNDYADAATGSIVIPANSTNATITVNVIGDENTEEDEQFTVTITSISTASCNVTLGNTTATATIIDDDFNCPMIGGVSAVTTVCSGETISLTANDLLNMAETENNGADFGIRFVAFPAPVMDPHTGGTDLGEVSFQELENNATTASLEVITPIVGGYLVIYAVLSPTAAEITCRPFRSQTVQVLACNITNDDDDHPNITDPCSCKNNATNLINGQFDELIQVSDAPAGQIWTVTAVDGLFQSASAAPPAAPSPITLGTILTEVPTTTPGISNYELTGVHVDAIGYSVTVSNGTTMLSINNRCWYPNPQFSNLSFSYCQSSSNITLSGTAQLGDATGEASSELETFTVINLGDGSIVLDEEEGNAVLNIANLPAGRYRVIYTFDAADDDPNMSHSGCSQSIEQEFEILEVNCGGFPWDGGR